VAAVLAGGKTMNKGEITRQRIIEEAAPIFNQRGYQACSIQALMEATGLEKGGIYRHFANKEELAAEAFRYALARVREVRLLGLDEIEGSMEKLRYLVRRFVETPGIVPGGCPLMNLAIDTDDGNPVLRGLALDGFRVWKTRLSGIVEEGIRRGEIRDDVEPRRIANVMVATLEGALMMSRLEESRTAILDAREMLETMLDGIAAV
jgi:TetR/AcrR family transcriptional regulator, transcriptional repressor for nem operon